MKQEYTLKNRIRGSLIAGAIGDALGYPVEFMSSFQEIQRAYGEHGITRLDTHTPEKKGVISDDTQMTLFTAYGMLAAKETEKAPISSITEALLGWLYTQLRPNESCPIKSPLVNIKALNVPRAPGNTCIVALSDILRNRKPDNHSKGCGGIMRIAAIPLYEIAQSPDTAIKEVDQLAGDAAKITHLHPLGFIPAAFVAHLIYRLATDTEPTRTALEKYIDEALETLKEIYAEYDKHLAYFISLIERAVHLSKESEDDITTIENKLGGGWVAEETAAIAIYCALKYFDDFDKAMIVSVNHSGDSDSTGAVTGNILGAAIGYNHIPPYFKEDLELHELILHVADDLWNGKISEFSNQ